MLRVPFPPSCWVKGAFSEKTLMERLAYLRRTNPAPVSISNTGIGFRKATVFIWDTKTEIAKRWIIYDFANDRWVELSVNYRKNSLIDEARFLNSLQLRNPIEKTIGAGSFVTLGDIENLPSAQGKSDALAADEPLSIINRSPALYTNAARTLNTQGTVKLRVTFWASGTMGNISILTSLPNGLTEEAINAARRLVFIPKRVAGVGVSITQEVRYDFRIY